MGGRLSLAAAAPLAATEPRRSHFDRTRATLPQLFGSYLPAHAAEAAAPQPAADACLPDPGQVITVEEQVIPFFPAGEEKEIYERPGQKPGAVFRLMHHAAGGSSELRPGSGQPTCMTEKWTEAGSYFCHPEILLETQSPKLNTSIQHPRNRTQIHTTVELFPRFQMSDQLLS